MRSRQTHIFATREDLIPGLIAAEKQLAIKYVRSDQMRAQNDFEELTSLAECKLLGRNETGDHMTGYRLLIVPTKLKVRVERIHQHAGGVLYALDQLRNPDSVSFLPGGIYDEQKILICGHIGTASESEVSIDLYKQFVRIVTNRFEKIAEYRVGGGAALLMDEGYRMVTISIGSPQLYDLRRS